MLDIVERLYNDTPNVHDSVEAGSEIQRLRDENKAQHAEIERLKRERDDAYDRAAQVCEERGGQIGGAIDPDRTAKVIRALKTKP